MTNSAVLKAPPENQATLPTLEMEGLIKNHIASIDKLKAETKQFKQMIEDVLLNDAVYKDHDQKAKEAAKIKGATKKQIMSQPAVASTVSKLKDTQARVKELSNALSEYLREYTRLTGTNEIEGLDGEVREIIFLAKVVKKSSLKA